MGAALPRYTAADKSDPLISRASPTTFFSGAALGRKKRWRPDLRPGGTVERTGSKAGPATAGRGATILDTVCTVLQLER